MATWPPPLTIIWNCIEALPIPHQAACKRLQAAYFKVQYHAEIAILNHLYNLSINEQFFPYDSI